MCIMPLQTRITTSKTVLSGQTLTTTPTTRQPPIKTIKTSSHLVAIHDFYFRRRSYQTRCTRRAELQEEELNREREIKPRLLREIHPWTTVFFLCRNGPGSSYPIHVFFFLPSFFF